MTALPWWSLPALVALVITALYVREANPAVGGGNSGEFQVMAHLLGIAHPPSYPLYLLLAKAATLLPLPGDIAWRINVLTALQAGSAVFLMAALPFALKLPVPRAAVLFASVLGAVSLGAMPRLWTLAVEAEVFALHLLLVLAFWLCLLRWRSGLAEARPTAARWLASASLIVGLGLANHRTFLFIAAAGALFVLLTRPRTLREGRFVALCLALVAAGLLPYLYVIRGWFVPVPFFSPGEVHRLTRSDIWYVLQGNATGETGGGDVIRQLFADRSLLLGRTHWLWRQLAGQFGLAGPVLAAAGIAGLLVLVRRRPLWTATALAGALAAAVFAMSYAKYPDADRYLLPLEALLALGLSTSFAGSASWLARHCAGRARLARILGSAGGLILGCYWALSLGFLAGSTNFTRGGYVHHTLHNLQGVERNALVCSWWASAWGWWYAQYVDGHRPDVALVPKGPDDCLRDVVPAALGRRPVYLPAMTETTRRSDVAFFPSRDLWIAVGRRGALNSGALLKGPDERIFYYDGAQRHWIPSLDVFASRGFSWDAVQLTPDYVLRDIPEGAPLGAQ
ncbi:MAG TPA: DUF2723 domain-containing protein [Chloroflexota bacterium]|nr:DUF2723 domain-containing protein [Chloroflexota bacterium]